MPVLQNPFSFPSLNMPRLALPALRLPKLGGGQNDEDDLPGLTEEEKDSLLSRLGGAIGSGAGYVGETLDKPGRAVRGLLAGRPGELANLIPFSDTLGITDPAKSTSGRDLLEMGGILGRNRPGLDFGDVLGAVAEIPLDPFIAISGPGKSLAAGVKAGTKAVRVGGKLKHLGVSPAKMIAEVASGERGLASIRLPFTDKPLAVLGTGEKASKFLSALYYNPVTRGLRQAFDYRVDGRSGKLLQQHADHTVGQVFDELSNYQDTILKVEKMMPKVQDAWDAAKQHFPAFAGRSYDEVVRTVAERKTVDFLSNQAQQMGLSPAVVAQAKELDNMSATLKALQDDARDSINSLGGNVGTRPAGPAD